jgi:hypothetical protein
MHAVRPKRAFAAPQFVDSLAETLSTYCPFSALAALSLLIAGPLVTLPRAIQTFVAVAAADVGLNLFRWWRSRRMRRTLSASIRVNVLV